MEYPANSSDGKVEIEEEDHTGQYTIKTEHPWRIILRLAQEIMIMNFPKQMGQTPLKEELDSLKEKNMG